MTLPIKTYGLTAAGAMALAASGASAQLSRIISVTPGGAPGNGLTVIAPGRAMSTYGRHAVFISGSSDLVPNDTNNAEDVFAADLNTGAVTRVSVSSAGVEPNGGAGHGQFGALNPGASISANGRYVAYPSLSSNLVAGDTNNWSDVFLTDRDSDGNGVFDEAGTLVTTRVSVSGSGAQGDSYSHMPTISGDGRYVCFVSHATNLVANDTNSAPDIFVRDTVNGTTIRASVSSSGTQANGGSGGAIISGDGRWVAFHSGASDLVAGDTNGTDDVFVRDLQSGATTRVSVDSAGAEANGASGVGAITADGRFVTFTSAATNLVAGDANGRFDIFVHDTQSAATVRVSVSTSGVEGNNHAWDSSISDDGRYVMFSTEATNIGAGAPWHAFVRDRDTDGNGVFDEAGGVSTTVASLLPYSIPSTTMLGPGTRWVAISGSGDFFAFSNGSGIVHGRGIADSDADGLLDLWETFGVDSNNDGVVDLTLAGADPAHKDLYLEVDAMAGRLPAATTWAMIIAAYAGAPAAAMGNPDGLPGVNLWVNLDETSIPLASFSGTNPWGPGPPAVPPANTFRAYKAQYFGTPAQRGAANWPDIMAAKLLVERYCFFGDTIGTTTISGSGEMPGNDFFVTLGGWTVAGGTAAQQAGLFMHELGHNLGLWHGGPWTDTVQGPVNYKPNYLSVQNYAWTFPYNRFSASWRLDYSPATLATLNESSLNEFTGIGGPPGRQIPVGPPTFVPPGTNLAPEYWLAPSTGSWDWNRNGLLTPVAQADVNRLWPALPASTGEVHLGFDDWTNIRWQIGGHPNFANGVSGQVVPTGEFTHEDYLKLNGGGWVETFEMYTPGTPMNLTGGWEIWCDGGSDAQVTGAIANSPPNALRISWDGVSPFGSDIVRPFDIDSGRWVLSMRTYVPTGAGGAGYVIMLNQYCRPVHNWSMQVAFDEVAGIVRSDLGGQVLPLIRDQWVEFRVEIDLTNDLFTEYYNGQILADNLVWSMNVSGQLGQPGITSIAALNLFSENIAEMYFDDIVLEPETCYADCNGDDMLNIADFGCFQTNFAIGNSYADCNGDTTLNLADFGCFQTKFAIGCP